MPQVSLGFISGVTRGRVGVGLRLKSLLSRRKEKKNEEDFVAMVLYIDIYAELHSVS